MKTRPAISDSARQQAIDWLLKLRSEQCSPSDREAFGAWLVSDPSHQLAYDTVTSHWDRLAVLKTSDFPARSAALSYRKNKARPYWAYAAAAVLLLAVGICALHQRGWLGVPITYIAEKGDKQSVTLADGSVVELNTETELSVRYSFWQRRISLVKGEAFFTVKHDAGRPFEVKAGNSTIRDIGTAFDVYLKPERVEIAVQEGLVEVESKDKRQLHAGQNLVVASNGRFENAPNLEIGSLTAWRTGRLVFRNRRLEDVLAELNRYHDVRIRVAGPALAEMRVSGTFQINQLEQTLTAITALLPVSLKPVGPHELVLQ